MRNNYPLLSWLIFIGLVAAILLPPVSWFLWSFGLPVESLFSAEGLRWLFLHAIEKTFNRNFFHSLLLCSAVGVWLQVLSVPVAVTVRRMGVMITFFVFTLILVATLLAAFHPSSALLSINGTITQSPFSRGFLPFAALSAAMLGVVYGFSVGAIRTIPNLVEVLVFGVAKYIAWLLLLLVFNFNLACVNYVFGLL